MILVPRLSLAVLGKLAPGTQMTAHRPVCFHSSKVLLLVKFITRFIGCLGLGQLAGAPLEPQTGFPHPLLLGVQGFSLPWLGFASRTLPNDSGLLWEGRNIPATETQSPLISSAVFPVEIHLPLVFPAITVELLPPLLSALCFCDALEAFSTP